MFCTAARQTSGDGLLHFFYCTYIQRIMDQRYAVCWDEFPKVGAQNHYKSKFKLCPWKIVNNANIYTFDRDCFNMGVKKSTQSIMIILPGISNLRADKQIGECVTRDGYLRSYGCGCRRSIYMEPRKWLNLFGFEPSECLCLSRAQSHFYLAKFNANYMGRNINRVGRFSGDGEQLTNTLYIWWTRGW